MSQPTRAERKVHNASKLLSLILMIIVATIIVATIITLALGNPDSTFMLLVTLALPLELGAFGISCFYLTLLKSTVYDDENANSEVQAAQFALQEQQSQARMDAHQACNEAIEAMSAFIEAHTIARMNQNQRDDPAATDNKSDLMELIQLINLSQVI